MTARGNSQKQVLCLSGSETESKDHSIEREDRKTLINFSATSGQQNETIMFMPYSRYKWMLRWIGIAALIIILCKIDQHAFRLILQDAEVSLLLAAAGLFSLQLAIKSFRWNRILSHCNIFVSRMDALKGYAAGAFLGTVTPGRTGEFSKAAMIRAWQPESSWGKAVGTVVLDRIIDVTTFSVVAIAGAFYFGLPPALPIAAERVSIFILLTGGILFLCLWRPLHQSVLGERAKAFVRCRFGPSAGDFYQVIRTTREPAMWTILGWTLLAHTLFFLHFFLLARAVGSGLSFGLVSWGIALASLGAILPLSISGIGVRDFILITLFSAAGEPPERTLAMSLFYLGIIYIVIPLMGIWPLLGSERTFTPPASERPTHP